MKFLIEIGSNGGKFGEISTLELRSGAARGRRLWRRRRRRTLGDSCFWCAVDIDPMLLSCAKWRRLNCPNREV